MAGSLNYMAPEVVKRESYGLKVDVWSALVVIFILVSGEMPFSGSSREEVIDSILMTDLEQLVFQSEISDQAKSFLLYGLDRDQDARPSAR